MELNDKEYREIILRRVRVCATYAPKFGQGSKPYGLKDFQNLYQQDPFYNWLGLDNPLMYAAHKAAGGMTSIYRQIGIGCEELFRKVLQDTLNLSDTDIRWSYSVPASENKLRTLSLDARIPTSSIKDVVAKERFQDWLDNAAISLDIKPTVRETLEGAIFEVRQGYKSKDSKRQNADIINAVTAYTKGYLPCVAVLSTQIDGDISIRYRTEKWLLLLGFISDSPNTSVYSFMKNVVGYDLAAFFERNSSILRDEVRLVLEKLLKP